jgi:hypothetical protein
MKPRIRLEKFQWHDGLLQCRCSAQLQVEWCCQLELQRGFRVNDGCASSMSVLRLSRCLRRASRLNAVRLYRDPASI